LKLALRPLHSDHPLHPMLPHLPMHPPHPMNDRLPSQAPSPVHTPRRVPQALLLPAPKASSVYTAPCGARLSRRQTRDIPALVQIRHIRSSPSSSLYSLRPEKSRRLSKPDPHPALSSPDPLKIAKFSADQYL